MIKKRKDGTKYYYYYKKKVGRKKKRGPKPGKPKNNIQIKNVSPKTNCEIIAKQCKTYKEFRTVSHYYYSYALKHDLLKNYTWLIDDRVRIFEDKVDCVYGYFFDDHHAVYIGRTLMGRANERDYEHVYGNSAVNKFCRQYDIPTPPMIILKNNLTLEEGLKYEDYYVKYYRNLGYNVLNKARTGVGIGSLGAIGKKTWTKEQCRKLVEQCEYKSDFRKYFHAAYKAAVRYGWLSTLFDGIEFKPKKYAKTNVVYKIDSQTMEIVERYNKPTDIADPKNKSHIYCLLETKNPSADGYIYRRHNDIIVDKKTNKVIYDKIAHKYE